MELPQGVKPYKGRYYLVRREDGKLVRHRLTRVDEGGEALLKALEGIAPIGSPKTIGDLLREFKLRGMKKLAASTVREYERIIDNVLIPTYGNWPIGDFRQTHTAQHLQAGEDRGAPSMANRERSCLASAFEFGMRRGYAETNPCRGVRRNTETGSKVYVETAQLSDTYDRAHEALGILLNAAYLSGMRQTELINLTRDQIKEDGIHYTESKTGKKNVKEWAPGFAEVVRRAIAYGDERATRITKRLPAARPLPRHVFVNTRGQPWTVWGINSAMRYADADFAFRQLRAKAQTDSEKNILGHTGQLRDRYTRRRKLASVG